MMPTVADLAADKDARIVANQAAYVTMAKHWPTRIQPWPMCRGTEGVCNSGQRPGRDGFCSVCHKRVVTLIVKGYEVHPLPVLRVSYATYRAKTPQSAPKHGRTVSKPAPVQHDPPAPTQALPRTFAEGVTVAFPSPEDVVKARAPVVPEAPAPMFGPGWAKAAMDMTMEKTEQDTSPMPAPATYGQIQGWLFDAREEIAAIKKNLNSRAFLTAQIARLDDRLTEIAKLRQRLAELENE